MFSAGGGRARTAGHGVVRFFVAAVLLAVGMPAAVAMGSYRPTVLGQDGVLPGDGEFVVLEPQAWVGKRFPLLDYIDIGDQLAQGEWIVVLYHHACPACRAAIAAYGHAAMCLASLLVALTAISDSTLPEGVPAPEEAELKAVAARRMITRGHVVFESKYRCFGEKPSERTRTTAMYFDDPALRNDLQIPYAEGQDGAGSYTKRTSFGPKDYVKYSDQVLPDGGKYVVTLRDADSVDRAGVGHSVVDPRLLGMLAQHSGVFPHFHLESSVAAPNRKKSLSTTVQYRGVECCKVEYVNIHDAELAIWIAPSLGYSVLRIESRAERNGVVYCSATDVNVKKHEPSGVWFPETAHFVETRNGEVFAEEEVTVTVASLNEPLDPEVFTIAGMEVPSGTRVHDLAEGRSGFIWDGESIVRPEEMATPPDKGLAFFLVSVGAAVVAAVCLWFHFRKRTTA